MSHPFHSYTFTTFSDCPFVFLGLQPACNGLGFVGLSGWGGGLSEYICVNANGGMIHPLPNNITRKCLLDPSTSSRFLTLVCFTVKVGAMVEPLAVAMHAVQASKLKAGDTALVVGTFNFPELVYTFTLRTNAMYV